MNFTFNDKPTQQRIQLALEQFTNGKTADDKMVGLFLELQWTYRTMQQQYDQLLGRFHLSESQFIILMFLEEAPNHAHLPSELADQLGSSRATITKLVNHMQKDGLVVKQHSKVDKRSVTIQITAQGSHFLKTFLPKNFEAVNTIMDNLSADEIQQLFLLLQKVKQGTQNLKQEMESTHHE
ncbi:MarR family winged helix-turn-helix transcriptional regulator [Loigolactobacillus jiayinensis]|uniref:MarR family winged helix-turn-helix transcriptional regulator n=1 Tax=Loigolactobacillus jiayinensis TaxID=2486016 RepID=A0ABW1RDR7_9LACO|nr:MarR family transcriptional regulator [Loigolactobacillus jiayinensis]